MKIIYNVCMMAFDSFNTIKYIWHLKNTNVKMTSIEYWFYIAYSSQEEDKTDKYLIENQASVEKEQIALKLYRSFFDLCNSEEGMCTKIIELWSKH